MSTHTMTGPRPLSADPGVGLLLRRCACGGNAGSGGECEECRRNRLQREAREGAGGGGAVPDSVRQAVRGGGQPLDASTRARMESRFGHDFSRVRIHADPPAARSAADVGARAYTVGEHVVMGPGQYAPGTTPGSRLLAHELAHVVQQGGSARVPDRIGPRGDAAEREAHAAADAVATGGAAPGIREQGKGVQRDDEGIGAAIGALVGGIVGGVGGKAAGAGAGLAAKAAAGAAAAAGSFKVNMTAATNTVSGTIEFTPDPKVAPKCKKIRLVQAVRVVDKAGKEAGWPGAEAPREKVRTAEDKAKGILPGYFVDHQAAGCKEGKGCSVYYRDHWSNPSSSQDGSNDGTTATKASLWDGPQAFSGDTFSFETCARCADSGSGAYMRCVDWGFSTDAAGKVTKTTPSEHAAPSATFTAAVAKFDKFYKNP